MVVSLLVRALHAFTARVFRLGHRFVIKLYLAVLRPYVIFLEVTFKYIFQFCGSFYCLETIKA